ncbi:MAG: hypothetical protein ACJ8C4_15380 [Gemmataceae bacterium]
MMKITTVIAALKAKGIKVSPNFGCVIKNTTKQHKRRARREFVVAITQQNRFVGAANAIIRVEDVA